MQERGVLLRGKRAHWGVVVGILSNELVSELWNHVALPLHVPSWKLQPSDFHWWGALLICIRDVPAMKTAGEDSAAPRRFLILHPIS